MKREEFKKVLIITSSFDCTVDYIMDRYVSDVLFYRFNIDLFEQYQIIIGDSSQWIITCSEWTLEKRELFSIYYRKPRLPRLEDYESDYRYMISKDIIAVVNGIVDDFEGRVLTKPYILRETENKIFQLLYAKKNGLKIPRSFIGNSNLYAKDFTKIKSIIKPITTGKIVNQHKTELYQTSYFSSFEESISLTPVYLQEYESKKYEVRLTYVNGEFFTVRIDSQDNLDWRRNYNGLKYSLIDCPETIKNSIIKLLDDFNLQFGAFDFIVNEKNEWIFLEVNPNGQWQWLEQSLHIPISKAIVRYLIM